jgi:hypothetical protein
MNYRGRAAALRIGGRDEFGHQRTACSLELLAEPTVEAPERLWVDWSGVALTCRFTRREASVWNAIWRDGAPDGRLLGLTRNQTGAASREILHKLRKNRDALHGFLGYLSESEIISQECFSTRQNHRNLGLLIEGLRMTVDELNQKKVTESAKLQRIGERVHSARILLEGAENAVARLESAFRTEQENAVLEERDWPTADVEKKFAAARGRVTAAESALSATMGAMERQAGIVEAIAGEIDGRRLEAFEIELGPAKERALELMTAFTESALELRAIAHRHGFTDGHALAQLLYPVGRDPLDGCSERYGRIGLLNAAIDFSDYLRRTYIGRTV